MIKIHSSAEDYFQRLLAGQDIDNLGLRLEVLRPGTPQADCELSFCEPADAGLDDLKVACQGFDLYVDAASVNYLDEAEMEYIPDRTGGQLMVKAPNIKGKPPEDNAPLFDRVQYAIDSEINPGLAAHKGRVSLVEISKQSEAVLQFGGGCHGCGMVDATLKNGVEKTLKRHCPDLAGVVDATDHASGENPYYQ